MQPIPLRPRGGRQRDLVPLELHDAIELLLIEDHPGDAELFSEYLAGARFRCAITHASSLREAFERMAAITFDVIVVDLELPDANGIEVLRTLHGRAPDVPIVVLTGLDADDLELDAIREQAQDYLVKGEIHPQALSRCVLHAVQRSRSHLSLRALLDRLPDVVVVKNAAGAMLYLNRAAKNLFAAPGDRKSVV